MSAFTNRWRWRSLPSHLSRPIPHDIPLNEVIDRVNARMRALDDTLNERMRPLDDTLSRWADDLEHGPVPGGYYPVQLSYTDPAGLTIGVKDLVPISFDAIVKAVYAYTNPVTDSLTIDINNGSTSILTTPLLVDASKTLNDPSDFVNGGIISLPDISLEIDSIDSGTPVHIRAVVILQNVTNVEDQ